MSLEENETFCFVEEQIELTQKNYSKKRSRISFIACDKCRTMKKKCDGDYLSQKSCSYCVGREEECKFSDSHKRRIVEVHDIRQFINRLEVISDEIQKLTDELKKFYELNKNQDDLKSPRNGYEFNSDLYVESLPSTNNSKQKRPEETNSRKPKSKTSGLKRKSREAKNDQSSSKQQNVTKGYFSKIYIPKGKYVTHQFDLKDLNETPSQFENVQYQPTLSSPNNSELTITDDNGFSNNTSNFSEDLSYIYSPSEQILSNPIFLYNDLNNLL
ncbi:12591_t:CDS:1 [Dentiscutata heterogama]|uniref:12591_t:CDS:1 n=1 Tax=Dentiscutata heterogama TaxID=1316150 RepID=A0ACA9M346_9GLOM|nr:12591_t:CDS:1 [Dentiscutata heterogama]